MRPRDVVVTVLLGIAAILAGSASAERADPTFRLMTSHSTVVNVKDAGSQNFAIEEDARGVIYIGNLSGIVEYDGEWWRLIKLPDDNSAYVLEALPDGRVATGGWNDFGYLEPDERGTMRYRSLVPLLPEDQRETGELGEAMTTPDGVMFLTTKMLALWTGDEVKVLAGIDYEKDYWRAFKVRGEVWLATAAGLKRLAGGAIEDVPGGKVFAERKVRMIAEWDETRALVYVREEGFYLFDGEKAEPFAPELWPRARVAFPFKGTRLRDGRLAIVTVSGGVMILDSSGGLDELIDVSTGLPDADIVGAHVASDGALWLVMDNNVTRVEAASPVTIVDTRGGLRGTPVAIVRHEGHLFVGTTSGLFRIDSGGMSWQSDDRRVARPVGEKIYSAWSLLSIGSELFAGTGSGVHLIRGTGTPELIEGTKDETAYAMRQSKFDPDRILVGTTNGFGSLKRTAGKWMWQGRIEGIPNAVRSIVEISENELWLGTSFDGVLRVTLNGDEPPTIRRHGESEVSVYEIGGRVVFTSDENHVQMISGDGLVPDTVLGSMGNGTMLFVIAEDPEGNVWLNSRPPGVALKQPDGSFVFDDRMLLGMPGRDVQAIYPDEGVVWFGTDQGLVKFDAHASWTVAEPRRPSIHRITVGGSMVDEAGPVSLRHNAGRLRFEVTAISYDPGVQYHYRLAPNETEWSEWTSEPVTEYTNLWEGEYTFHVQTRSPRGELSPELTWSFTVLPPWYRTRLAYSIWILLGALVVIGVPILRNRALKQRARLLERKVAEQTVELTEAVAKLAFANECLDVMSRNDALTGIPNRRQFDEKLQEEWSRGRRSKDPVGFILVDLDHFKALNDSKGHHAGDMALKTIGEYLRSSMRRTGDLAARLGGEEFAVILPNTDLEGTRVFAEQLRTGFVDLGIAHADSPNGVLTASFGVTSMVPGEDQSPSDLLVSADRALYKAKAEGRNCVRSDEDATA